MAADYFSKAETRGENLTASDFERGVDAYLRIGKRSVAQSMITRAIQQFKFNTNVRWQYIHLQENSYEMLCELDVGISRLQNKFRSIRNNRVWLEYNVCVLQRWCRKYSLQYKVIPPSAAELISLGGSEDEMEMLQDVDKSDLLGAKKHDSAAKREHVKTTELDDTGRENNSEMKISVEQDNTKMETSNEMMKELQEELLVKKVVSSRDTVDMDVPAVPQTVKEKLSAARGILNDTINVDQWRMKLHKYLNDILQVYCQSELEADEDLFWKSQGLLNNPKTRERILRASQNVYTWEPDVLLSCLMPLPKIKNRNKVKTKIVTVLNQKPSVMELPNPLVLQLQALRQHGVSRETEMTVKATYHKFLIQAGKKGEWKLSFQAYRSMLQSKIIPDLFTYQLLFIACRTAKPQQPNRAYTAYTAMKKKGLLPSLSILNVLLSTFGESGQWRRAVRIFKELTTPPYNLLANSNTYEALTLVRCYLISFIYYKTHVILGLLACLIG